MQNPEGGGRLRLLVCFCSKVRLVESGHHQRQRCPARGTGLNSALLHSAVGVECVCSARGKWRTEPISCPRGCGTPRRRKKRAGGCGRDAELTKPKEKKVEDEQEKVVPYSKITSGFSQPIQRWAEVEIFFLRFLVLPVGRSVGPMRRITKTKHGGKERQHTTRALVGEP